MNFNPYHDKRERFASGDATGGGASPKQTDGRETSLDRLASFRKQYLFAFNALRMSDITAGRQIQNQLTAIDNEVKRYPLPPQANGTSLSRFMVGRWDSPRHEYLYRRNHTWTMLPIEENVTRGVWKIGGNRYVERLPWGPIE